MKADASRSPCSAVFAAILVSGPLTARAADLSDLTWTSDGTCVTITDCDAAATGILSIPATIDSLPVCAIADFAFGHCRDLTSVSISNGLTSIGNDAFYLCSGITSISIPNSVTSIGNFTFSGCSGLTSVSIPDSVTSIGDAAFSGCSSLTVVSIPNRVTSIGYGAFQGCRGLTSISIPSSVTSIGYNLFYDCSGLTGIYFMGSAPPDPGEVHGFSGTVIYVRDGSSGWGSTYMGRPVVILSDRLEVEIQVVSGMPTLHIASSPGESFSVFRFNRPGDGGTPFANVTAASSGDTTSFTDNSPPVGQGFYSVIRN